MQMILTGKKTSVGKPNKKPLACDVRAKSAFVIVRGADRNLLKPGLSDKATRQIERYEEAHARAWHRLKTNPTLMR